jgi:hypothetical protein
MDKIRSKKRFLVNIVTFYVLLCYAYYYYFYIFQNYLNKIGFRLDLNYLKLVEGFVIIMLLSLFFVYNNLNQSVYLMFSFVLYTFIMVPSACYYFLSNQSRNFFYMQVIVFLILDGVYLLNKRLLSGMSNHHHCGILDRVKNRNNGLVLKLFVIIVGLFMLADIVIYIKYGNSILYLFKLDKISGIRLKARKNVPGNLKYIISWSAMVIVPSSIAWCLKKKKYILLVLPVIIQILVFTIGGTKSHIFILVLVVFLYLLFKYRRVYWFVPCMNVLLAISLLLNNTYIMAVVIKRTFFYPMSISYNYYDFFTQYPQMKLSGSILKHFFNNPYKIDAPFIISRYVYKTPVMSANTNFISNAFANFGFFGIIVFTLIVAAILVVIERISYNKIGKEYVILFTFCSFFALVNSALFTTLMTHGLLFALFLAYLFFFDGKREDSL